MDKKIATSLEVLIKVAQYESIRLTKYGETKIEYSSKEEMIQKENQLQAEVMDDLLRSMRALPNQIGKSANAVVEIEEKIQKRIPEWLEKGAEPNIADTAKKSAEKSEAIAHDENEQRKETSRAKETDTTATEMDDLFSSDPSDSDGLEEDIVPDENNVEDNDDLFA